MKIWRMFWEPVYHTFMQNKPRNYYCFSYLKTFDNCYYFKKLFLKTIFLIVFERYHEIYTESIHFGHASQMPQ